MGKSIGLSGKQTSDDLILRIGRVVNNSDP